MFKSASERSKSEYEARKKRGKNILKYGISFLDDATKGILRSDLILIGAPSGMGKTALCCNIALANIQNEKRVHYIALEADQTEIESRMKFQLIANMFFADKERPNLGEKFSFDNWYLGRYAEQLKKYEDLIQDFFEKGFKNLFTFYKSEKYGLSEFIESVTLAANQTDLIIVDHVHYFDLETDNENKAMKEIASMARTLALENEKPIILVAHLRKKDKGNPELVSGMDEFHGSSDLYKIATKVITFAGGKPTMKGNYATYFRIPKNRLNGGTTRYIARMFFNPSEGNYKNEYKLGRAEQSRDKDFEDIAEELYPDWAKYQCRGAVNNGAERTAGSTETQRGSRFLETVTTLPYRD